MEKELKKLLEENNSQKNGIYIPLPIDEYVGKIYLHSTIIPYIVQGELKGFISYYNNDSTTTNAYLTMLLVATECHGQGVGKLLLNSSIQDLKRRGFRNYSLEVLKDNEKAGKLYSDYGFSISEDRGNLWLMTKNLEAL